MDDSRPLSAWLILAILSVPLIFVWLLLRRGYSAHVRRGAFLYTAMGLLFSLGHAS